MYMYLYYISTISDTLKVAGDETIWNAGLCTRTSSVQRTRPHYQIRVLDHTNQGR